MRIDFGSKLVQLWGHVGDLVALGRFLGGSRAVFLRTSSHPRRLPKMDQKALEHDKIKPEGAPPQAFLARPSKMCVALETLPSYLIPLEPVSRAGPLLEYSYL